MATGITVESVLGAIIQGHLECSICHTRYQEPKMLDCSHSFCLRCLQELQQSQKPDDDKITCPLCQRETILPEGGVAKLTTNYGLISLVEEVTKQEQLLKGEVSKVICQSCDEENDAISRCMDCEYYLCQLCQTVHQRLAALKTHKIVPVDEIEGESVPNTMVKKDMSKCDIHPNKELCFYCNTCEMLICKQCTASSHKEPTHMYNDLKTAIGHCLREAREKISHTHSIDAYNKISASWQSLRDRLGVMFGETNTLISQSAEQKIKEIKHKEKQLKLKAQVMYRKKDKKLAEMEVAEHTVKMVHKEMTDVNYLEILKVRQDLLHDLKDANGGETEDLSRDVSFISFKENKNEVELGSVLQKEKWELLSTSEITGDFIAAFSTGDMVIANTDDSNLTILSPNCEILSNASLESDIINIAVNKDDELTVLCNDNDDFNIMILNKEYNVLNQFQPGKEANIDGKPTCLAVDDNNLIVVGYKDKEQVSLHNQDGTLIKKLPAPMIDKYLTISNKQLIYTNSDKKELMGVDYEGNIKFNVHRFDSPHGVCCDKAGDVHVCAVRNFNHHPQVPFLGHSKAATVGSPLAFGKLPSAPAHSKAPTLVQSQAPTLALPQSSTVSLPQPFSFGVLQAPTLAQPQAPTFAQPQASTLAQPQAPTLAQPQASICHYSQKCKFIEEVPTDQKSPSGITYTPDGKLAVTGVNSTQIYHRV